MIILCLCSLPLAAGDQDAQYHPRRLRARQARAAQDDAPGLSPASLRKSGLLPLVIMLSFSVFFVPIIFFFYSFFFFWFLIFDFLIFRLAVCLWCSCFFLSLQVTDCVFPLLPQVPKLENEIVSLQMELLEERNKAKRLAQVRRPHALFSYRSDSFTLFLPFSLFCSSVFASFWAGCFF